MIKTTAIDRVDLQENEIFVPVFEKEISSNVLFDKIEQNKKVILLDRANKFGFLGKKNQRYSYKNYHFVGLGEKEKFTKKKLRAILFDLFKSVKDDRHSEICLLISSHIQKQFNLDFELVRLILDSFYLSQYTFDKYKSEKDARFEVELNVVCENEIDHQEFIQALDYSKALDSGITLSRDLINEPAAYAHPESLVKEAMKLQDESDGLFQVEVLDAKQCADLGMGAFLSVSQGSSTPPKFIIIKYLPNNDEKSIVLIGKSVTFDSGGLSLKPAKYMYDMKTDMAGGAIVLGVFKALNLSSRKLDKNIVGILPVCENMPGSKAVHPGDIVTALNGKTIEVLNSDAEGRLTLADAMAYAEKYLNPKAIIDISTLTGALLIALGEDIAGMFGNNKDFNALLNESAKEEAEEIWELPLYDDYEESIKSNIADLQNISITRYGDAIVGALFLKNFITDKIKWIHLDIGGTVYNKMATGWGVRTVINLLNKKI